MHLIVTKKNCQKAAEYLECQVGIPKNDDDEWNAKLDIIQKHRVPAVSFTFGCPDREIVASLKGIGSRVFVTITTPQEAEVALRAGADALCLQGIEAGGHRSTFLESSVDYPLMKLLKEVRSITKKPLIVAGGLMTGSDIKRVFQEGASAAQLGTALFVVQKAERVLFIKKAFFKSVLMKQVSHELLQGNVLEDL